MYRQLRAGPLTMRIGDTVRRVSLLGSNRCRDLRLGNVVFLEQRLLHRLGVGATPDRAAPLQQQDRASDLARRRLLGLHLQLDSRFPHLSYWLTGSRPLTPAA